MSPRAINEAGEAIDLSGRFFFSKTVAASPAAAAETTVATVTITGDAAMQKGILLAGMAAFTVGTSGVSATLRIRQTDTSGTVIVTSGALTVAATNLVAPDVHGIDAAAVLPGQVYVLTLQIGSGAAASAVSAVALTALVI